MRILVSIAVLGLLILPAQAQTLPEWAYPVNPPPRPIDDKVQKRFNAAAGGDHAYGYDCMSLVLTAFKEAASIKPDAVAKAMLASKFVGLHGKYVFNPKNHTVNFGPDFLPLPTAQIQNGKSVIFWPEAGVGGQYIAPK